MIKFSNFIFQTIKRISGAQTMSNSKLLTTYLSKHDFLERTEFQISKSQTSVSEMLGVISSSFNGNPEIYKHNDECSEIASYTKVDTLTNGFTINNLKEILDQ